ncbi:hypothetical protein D9613_008836 [Agrocybe pediades]|uniref:Uncharacterized protein n=1 Tax=Agrocybe pediades TaxID=84607 RepID=A0A8H4QTS5_9AGAR|nr:hypothetical protein D9613_008836 [Agrocybe pediades]
MLEALMLLYAVLYYFASSNLSIAAPPSSSGRQFPNGMISSVSLRDTDTVDLCPRTRLEIIWTCLATIFAASWVAVHPNMPGPNVSKVKKTLLRIEVMLWAIVTPEFIVMWAMQQWYGQKYWKTNSLAVCIPVAISDSVNHSLNADFSVLPGFQKPNDAFKWTKKHGFFLQMGGFVLYEKEKPRRILEWRTLMEYYENGRVDLAEITEATIDDRSKADGFGKCIALIQTSWFIIQCISARFSDERLKLTQLELVTAALAVLSLLMYCFWWNKPFIAEVPIVIILLDPVQEIRSHQDLSIQIDGDVLPIHIKTVSKFRASTLAGIDFVRSKLLNWNAFKKLALMPYNVCKYVLVCVDELTDPSPPPVYPYSMKVPIFYYSEGVTSRESQVLLNQIGSSLVAAVFGAIHCAGWSDKIIFHTRTVSLLWRISSVIITGSPLLWILNFISGLIDDAGPDSEVLENTNSDALFYVTGWLSILSIPFYIIARIMLLILAFVELRYVPQGALNNIPWVNVPPFIH